MAGKSRLIVGAVLILCLAPASAQAATVSVEPDPFADRVRFEAAPGEANRVNVGGSDDSLTFVDHGAPLTPGEGCTGGGSPGAPVVCTPTGQLFAPLNLRLGDLGDWVNTSGVLLTSSVFVIFIEGAGGDDTIVGGPEWEQIDPGRGADRAHGGSGQDTWVQRTRRPDGGDRFVGGPHSDSVRYEVPYPVRAKLDGRPNDGARREGDNLLEVERVFGTDRADVIVGDRHRNELQGGGGEDRVLGGRGSDIIFGGIGDDVLHGGRGDDFINAKRHILGTSSGRDRIDCGPGLDVAIVHRGDRVRNCEEYQR